MPIPNHLKTVRTRAGMVQQDLAVRAHVSNATLVAIERYGYVPSQPTQHRIAEALGVPVATIWPADPGSTDQAPSGTLTPLLI